jgi:hypothetical protein
MASIQDLLSSTEEPVRSQDRSVPSTENQQLAISESLRFTIEFVLDTICPHCYIGLRNLNTAIETYKRQHPGAVFEITCSPILLAPSAGRSGKFLIPSIMYNASAGANPMSHVLTYRSAN